MKKITAILLALALVLCSCAALAEEETASVYANIELPLPEGAEILNRYEDSSYFAVQIAKDGVADVYLVVAPSELFNGLSLADLSEEEMKELQELLLADLASDTTCTVETTPDGNQYLFIRERGESSSNTIVTLYRGYFIQLNQFEDDFSDMDEADDNFLLDILHALNIPTDAE